MRKRRIAPFRIGQIIGTIVLNGYIFAYIQNKIIYSGFFKHIPEPVLNCYGGPLSVFACPMGSLQQFLGQKGVDLLHRIPWVPLGLFLVIGAFVGRAACAWVCPFGLWQDLLYKIKAGPRAGSKRWLGLGIIGFIGVAAVVLLVLFLRVAWWKALLFGWLPFMALLGFIGVRGKMALPGRLWVGSWLVGIGLGLLVMFKFDVGPGVATGVVGMTLLGLVGGWHALALAAPAGFILALLGNPVRLGPFASAELALVTVLLSCLLIILLDRVLKLSVPATMLKFAYLVLVAGVLAWNTAEPWFCKLCPQGTLEAGLPLVLWDPVQGLRQLVGWLFYFKVAILLAVVLAAIAIKRPFCRLICPIGAIYSLFNRASLLHMRLDTQSCSNCNLCRKVCPMGIEPHQGPNQAECIRCFECVWHCPKSSLRIRV
ncbi:MAG: 4Fe-4S binding protein [candidate division WOR-3 bacterium]